MPAGWGRGPVAPCPVTPTPAGTQEQPHQRPEVLRRRGRGREETAGAAGGRGGGRGGLPAADPRSLALPAPVAPLAVSAGPAAAAAPQPGGGPRRPGGRPRLTPCGAPRAFAAPPPWARGFYRTCCRLFPSPLLFSRIFSPFLSPVSQTFPFLLCAEQTQGPSTMRRAPSWAQGAGRSSPGGPRATAGMSSPLAPHALHPQNTWQLRVGRSPSQLCPHPLSDNRGSLCP